MLSDRRRDEQEKKAGREVIQGAVGNTLRMTSENNDWMIDQADQSIARVRQRDSITNTCAVQLLAFVQGLEQRFSARRLFGQLGNLIHQLEQDRFPIVAPEVQSD